MQQSCDYFTQQSCEVLCTMCECFTQQSCECLTHDVRLFMRRGRGGAKGRILVTDEKNGEKFGGVGNNDYLCSVN